MARRFVRVDVSQSARDFQPVAIEPGIALLDKANANSRLLFKWLGRLAAEAEWQGDSINYFVQDDHGGRLVDVLVQTASDEDLQGVLKDEVALLAERLANIRPDSPSERLVLGKIREDFRLLIDDPKRLDRDCFFFRYRDQQRIWRLVWCVGYQRKEAVAAPAVICTNPDCNMLFVRRPSASAHCPGCRSGLLVQAMPRNRRWLVAVVLLLLLCAAAAWLLWRRSPEPQIASGLPERSRIESGPAEGSCVGSAPSKSDAAPSQPAESVPAASDTPTTPNAGTAPSVSAAANTGAANKAAASNMPSGSNMPAARDVAPASHVPAAANTPTPLSSSNKLARPSEVVVLSDQGATVRFPVGGEFDDFRVEARYADGFTRIVTQHAGLRTSGPPESAPVSFVGGRMLGIRPGKTNVVAEFAGVVAKQSLEVEVTASADVDQIRLVPSPAVIRPGETFRFEAVGYRDGRSVGIISGSNGLTWKSSDDAVVRVVGPMATGQRLGQANVTAQLGRVASAPAQVTVVEADPTLLSVEPNALRLRVSESIPIGEGVSVLRGNVDVSRQATVEPSSAEVRYDSATHSIVGVAPGLCSVRFGYGDQLANAFVRVVEASYNDGTVSIEPSAVVLSRGQAMPLRVFLTDRDGLRVDRTAAAELTSTSADKVQITGNWACAVSPGTAEITATLPESSVRGRATITVDNHPITGLVVEPPRIALAVGDRAPFRVLGRSGSGLRELFPQDRLVARPSGSSPNAIRIVGSQHVEGVRPGTAAVEVTWSGKLRAEAPVIVSQGEWTHVAIDPAAATIHPGQRLGYTVSGVRGGRRRVSRPEDGLTLSVVNPSVAQVSPGNVVRGLGEGQTAVVAQVGSSRAESPLTVVAGRGISGVSVTTPGVGLPFADSDGTGYIIGREGVVEPHWGGPWDADFSGPPAQVGAALPAADRLWIEPARAVLGVGETTPRFRVMAQSPGGLPREIPAAVESVDPRILAPVAGLPGRFTARQMGSTQVRAAVGERPIFAEVAVTGARFDTIRTWIASLTDENFAVRAEITSTGEENLEYRICLTGQRSSGPWVAAQLDNGRRRVVVESPRIPIGPPSAIYSLMFEVRDPAVGTIQQYPFTFRLAPQIERAER